MAAFDPKRLDDDALARFIAFLERHGARDDPRYLAAFEERMRRNGQGLEPDRTVELIRSHASRREYLTYGDIAKEARLQFFRNRKRIFDHLGDVAAWSYRIIGSRPLLSAVVVSEPHRQSGRMEGETLAGFIRFASSLGAFPGGDEAAFLSREQEKVFAWAQPGAGAG